MLRVHTHTYILYYTLPKDNSTNTPLGRRLELLGFFTQSFVLLSGFGWIDLSWNSVS